MTPSGPSGKKICFVIAQIGAEGSPERARSDQVFRHIIKVVIEPRGYEPLRADHLGKPGLITSQIVEHLLEDPLVIADLTGSNPNVYYELAIRHAVRKPVVLLASQGERLPFDVAPSRTIRFDHHDLDSVANCIQELSKQVEAAEKDPDDIDSPVSVTVDVRSLKSSGDLTAKTLSQIIDQLQDLAARVQALSPPKPAPTPLFSPVVQDFSGFYSPQGSTPVTGYLMSPPAGAVNVSGVFLPVQQTSQEPVRKKKQGSDASEGSNKT